MKLQSVIAIQDKAIRLYVTSKPRMRALARGRAQKLMLREFLKMGYTRELAWALIDDAMDMARLQLIAEEAN
jgi:hypothetical protein